jgi:hypothetical protein
MSEHVLEDNDVAIDVWLVMEPKGRSSLGTLMGFGII